MPSYQTLAENIIGSEFLASLGLHRHTLDARAREAAGMLSAPERALLVTLVRDHYRGDGAIIDGGSFFGSSLVAEATGLEAHPDLAGMDFSAMPDAKPIHGYELGFLPAPKSDKVDPHRVFGGVPYKLGDSFVPILEKNIAPHAQNISLHIGDLNAESWPKTAPIEIAFIDVCKTIALNAHVAREFYSPMIGGASVLINQDFFFDRLPWIKVTMGYLRDYYRWEGQVFTSSVYTSIKAVPQDVADHDPFTEASLEECLAYHDATEFPGLERKWRYFLALSRGYLMALKNDKNGALEYLAAVSEDYADLLDDGHTDRGNQFRMDRAVRQITNGNIFRVS